MSDTDGDGIGNIADSDDDNDGVLDAEDLLPLYLVCALARDIRDGECLLSQARDYDTLLLDSDGILYFIYRDSPEILRWDARIGHFIEPLVLSPELYFETLPNFSVFYFAEHHALYVGYSGGVITRIDLQDEIPYEGLFLDSRNETDEAAPVPIDATPNALVVRRSLPDRNSEYMSYTLDGELIDSWISGEDDRGVFVAYRNYYTAPFCESGFTIEEASSIFVSLGSQSLPECAHGAGADLIPAANRVRAYTPVYGVIDDERAIVKMVTLTAPRWGVDMLYDLYSDGDQLVLNRYFNKLNLVDVVQIGRRRYGVDFLVRGVHAVIVRKQWDYLEVMYFPESTLQKLPDSQRYSGLF